MSLVASVPEFAQKVGVSRAHAYRLVANGTIKSIRLGKRVVIPLHEIDRLLGLDGNQ